MQLSEQTFPAATMYNYLFYQSRRRNRIEFIDDFPNEAEVISSVQIHPMGWNALSRNVSSEEDDEVFILMTPICIDMKIIFIIY